MKTVASAAQLLDQDLALSAYLDALLGRALAEPDSAGQAPPAGTAPEPPDVDAPPRSEPVHTGDGRQDAAGVCEWAQGRFQALLFEVAGLTLAVPLVKLKGVVPNDGGVTPMPGHPVLFLGVVPYQGRQSKVVDTARFVLPGHHATRLGGDAGERSGHLVMIDEGRWALACNRIGDVIELETADVKWRTANGKRLWLAGTVIERMCALLDIDELVRLLEQGMA
jgi:purine-binding chemotaxis protein CheW